MIVYNVLFSNPMFLDMTASFSSFEKAKEYLKQEQKRLNLEFINEQEIENTYYKAEFENGRFTVWILDYTVDETPVIH